MKKILLLLGVTCINSLAFGQSNTKMDFYLTSKLGDYTAKKANSNIMLPILIQGKINTIKQLVQKNGGTFRYSYGNIAAITIPLGALSVFNESSYVTRMEGAPLHLHPCNDTMRLKSNIVAVQNGLAPLSQAYKGKGIVIGFIDTGIDYTHPDFIDNSGKSRVKYYWDQNRTVGSYPSTFGYGQAWNEAEIDAGHANDSSSTIDYGHGSNVAGTAAGNGRANGTCIGGAPDCDIIFVALNFNSSYPYLITDAVNYIYTMADSLHEPCVINASLGNYDGSHDGLDLQAEMIDNMILAKQPGRAFVASAGNAGGIPFHVHDSLTGVGDTTFTWFKYDGGYGIVDIPIFANKTDFTHVKFRIRCDKVQTGSYSERDANNITYFDFSTVNTSNSGTAIYNANSQRLGIVYASTGIYGPTNNNYSLEFFIVPDSTSYLWGFEATGTGRFDIWDLGTINGVQDTTGLLLNPFTYPEIKKYKQPDSLENICSSFQCSPNVITVANYGNRKCYTDYDSVQYCGSNGLPGQLNHTSSWGPTRNYTLIKPDIASPGQCIMSALPTGLKASYITYAPQSIDEGGWHNEDAGTSLAAPGVTSVVALYMEAYPTATSADIWNAITGCDSIDKYTGATPNYKFGYGKVDAFKALVGCTPAGIENITLPNSYTLKAFPNPAAANTTIAYDFSSIKNYNKAEIVFYNMLGKEVKSIYIQNNQGTVNAGGNTLSAGMYFYSLIVDGARLKTEKLEVL